MNAPLIQMENLQKSFGSVAVLRGVNLELFPGEVHALLGENGAGKSTLMKVLSGTYPHGEYGGRILLNGKEVAFSSPDKAAHAGISIIHQELSAFPDLTVAENLCVGSWPRGLGGVVDWAKIEAKAIEWFRKSGIAIHPQARMGDLPIGSQQIVEIAKALSRDANVIILDEPTSSLGPQESQRLFEFMRTLKSEGKALVYISHRMEEIFGQCQRVTVLRDGQSVLTSLIKDTTEAKLVAAMVGRPLDRLFPERSHKASGEILLELNEFSAVDRNTGRRFGPLSLKLRAGEIVGFGGLLGAGRSELMQALLGDETYRRAGSASYAGHVISPSGPRAAYRSGLSLVGEDRRRDSLFPTRSIEENSATLRLNLRSLLSLISPGAEGETVHAELLRLHTAYQSSSQLITELSGGNQHKVIFSRVLQAAPRVVILDEPTRGVDVGAKFEIYQILFDLAKSGLGILLVSSDLPELMALSDRVVVLSEGRQKGVLEGEEIAEERIMALAVGRGATQ
ncbi:MAG: sugar ABC transporter ATP-binding protein [Bdellovibrionota bacterium]